MIQPGRPLQVGPDALSTLPCSPGVYLFYATDGELLYIGKSVNLRDRVRSYFRKDGGHTRRTERLKHEAHRIDAYRTCSELEALLLESRLIKAHLPRYNVRGRRYEHYPFLKIADEVFPRLVVTRSLDEDGARYYGPFLSASHLRAVVEILEPLFGLRTCAVLPDRPCFQLDIKRCLGPCTGRVGDTYAEAVLQLDQILRGDAAEVCGSMRQKMLAASDACDFERAAKVRDRLHAVEIFSAQQAYLNSTVEGHDVLVVLPGHPAPAVTFLAIRRARWVGQLTLSPTELASRSAGKQLRDFMTRVFVHEAAPPARIGKRELDEVQIVGSWLYRHRTQPGVFAAGGDAIPDQARAILGYARKLRPSR